MLVDEARLASRIRHHNVVSILDVVQTADELLLVMEYVHGESFAKLLRWSSEQREPVPIAIAVAIAIDALHGLHAAHEATDEHGAPLDLVHRDVSPQNILVGLDGITRIADFGVAKATGRVQSTRDGTVKGKLAYMAPEQISGGEVTRLSDAFALAIVLWEALAGARLFSGENDAERVFKVMAAPIARPSTRRADVPGALDAIVMRGLERDPSRRYGSAREMALALERAAPSVRPSEIASWVERVVAGRLAERARILHAIEHGVDDLSDALTAPCAQSEVATGTRPRRAVLQWQNTTQDRAPSTLLKWMGAVVALLTLLGVIAWSAASRRAPASPPPANMTVAVEQRVSPETIPTPPPVIPVESAGSTLEPSAPSEPSAVPPREKRRVRPARKSPASACDPPYSIDPAGRVLFKVECM